MANRLSSAGAFALVTILLVGGTIAIGESLDTSAPAGGSETFGTVESILQTLPPVSGLLIIGLAAVLVVGALAEVS